MMMLDINECKTFYNRREMIVIHVFRLEKQNKIKQNQISNIVSLFYIELNGMHFVI